MPKSINKNESYIHFAILRPNYRQRIINTVTEDDLPVPLCSSSSSLFFLFQFQLLSARCPHTSSTLFCSRILFLGFEVSGMNSWSFHLQMPAVLFKFPGGFLPSKRQSSRCLHSSFSCFQFRLVCPARALSANYCVLGRQNQKCRF